MINVKIYNFRKLVINAIIDVGLYQYTSIYLRSISGFSFEIRVTYKQSIDHRQQNKWYPKGVRLSQKLQLTTTLCNEI